MTAEWMSGNELAEWLKIGRDTVTRAVASGDLPQPVRIGRQYRFDKAAVAEHLERRAAGTAGDAPGSPDAEDAAGNTEVTEDSPADVPSGGCSPADDHGPDDIGHDTGPDDGHDDDDNHETGDDHGHGGQLQVVGFGGTSYRI